MRIAMRLGTRSGIRPKVRNLGRAACQAALLLVCALDLSAPAQKVHPATSSSGNRVISGVVVSAVNGQPLNGADVTLTGANSSQPMAETTTDAEGRFVFTHLAAGKFSLRAAHRGYMTSAFDEHGGFSTAIVTGEGLVSTDLKFTLQPLAVIYGVVADDSGDPVQQARISLYRQEQEDGTGKIVRAGGTVTDDLGNYEFPRLAQGNYYIAVTAQPWYATRARMNTGTSAVQDRPHSPLDVAYATVFYADVTDSDSATPIPVKAGDRIPVNFMLHPVPAVHISLEIPNAGPGQALMMPQLHQEIFGSSEFVGMQAFSTMTRGGGNGSFGMTTVELSGVGPGHYEMDFSAHGETTRTLGVDAMADNQVLDANSAQGLADVSGKVSMAGGASLPRRLIISLAPQHNESGGSARVERDGTFQIHGVHPGTYEVSASGGDAAIAPIKLTATGATVDGHLLKIGTAPVTLTATLVEGAASVSGFAKADGKPAAGVLVLLVPANPGADSELFRRDQSDSDGSFNFEHVIPGEYTIVAITDGWTLDWAHPEVISRYLPKGLMVTVSARSGEMHVNDAVEVQAK
jgi:5-hydroxyisourate hydrolase-like protein (transthyretin family)